MGSMIHLTSVRTVRGVTGSIVHWLLFNARVLFLVARFSLAVHDYRGHLLKGCHIDICSGLWRSSC